MNIKMSQFHHSCHPNTVVLDRKDVELRAIRKIKAGDEITMNRNSSCPLFGLFPRNYRLKILCESEYFICSCEICQGVEDSQDVPNTIARLRLSLEEKNQDKIMGWLI